MSTSRPGASAWAPPRRCSARSTRRYVDAHFGSRPRSRFVALIGDAELDEGNIWEAITEEAASGLGEVCWIIDLNRQSLDRVVPGIRAGHLEHMFSATGWNVIEVKYGPRLRAAFERPGGDALRRHLDMMPNQAYQAMFSLRAAELRDRFLLGADPEVKRTLANVDDGELAALLHDLGGHDLGDLLTALRAADAVEDQPSVIFAYTVKGWGLPFAGSRLNHAALLSPAQLDALRDELGIAPGCDWDLPLAGSPEGDVVAAARRRLGKPPAPLEPRAVPIPESVGARFGPGPVATQEAFGRVLGELANREEIAKRIVTVTPDVAISTNLGGWINKRGVFAPVDELDFGDGSGLLSWRPSPHGQHIELGISEMNLFLLLGQLGLAHDLSHEQLLPVGTVYDPFVCRGLDAFIYSLYSGARFVIAGTPSGITLSAEGGAHQSTITSSIGFELPGLEYAEPAYAQALEWVLCDSLRRVERARRIGVVSAPLDPAARPGAVPGCEGAAGRRDAAAPGRRRRLSPRGLRTRLGAAARASGRRRAGPRRGGRGSSRARGGGGGRERDRPDRPRPAVPRVAGVAANRHAPRPDANRAAPSRGAPSRVGTGCPHRDRP